MNALTANKPTTPRRALAARVRTRELCSQGHNVQLVRVGAYDYSALAISLMGQDGHVAQDFRQTPSCRVGAGD